MSKRLTIYLNSSGSVNGVNVIQALKKDFRIVAGDVNSHSAGLYLADKRYVMPPTNGKDFLPKLLDVCIQEDVDVALPIHSGDFLTFYRIKSILEAYGIRTYSVNPEIWNICNDKLLLAYELLRLGIPTPATWPHWAILDSFPLFIKRKQGSGSVDVKKVENKEDLRCFLKKGFVAQEYLDGTEYTVDVISDLSGNMLMASPRIREETRDGMCTKGTTVEDQEIVEWAKKIVEGLRLPGPSNVQCKRTEDGLKFYDVNPRFGCGGLPLTVAAGLNIPKILVHLIMQWPLPELRVKPGIVMLRYYDSLILNQRDMQYEYFLDKGSFYGR